MYSYLKVSSTKSLCYPCQDHIIYNTISYKCIIEILFMLDFGSTCINLNIVYNKFNVLRCHVILQIHKQTSL